MLLDLIDSKGTVLQTVHSNEDLWETRRRMEIQVQVHVDPKLRQVITRRVNHRGRVLHEERRRARRQTRVHLIDGSVDVVESVEGVAGACQAAARASGMFQANVIGGHGQITVNFVPVSSVVRLEDLRR